MKKEDKLISIINAHIHNHLQMQRSVNAKTLKEWFLQIPSDKLRPYLSHVDPVVKRVATEVQKLKLG